MDKILATPSKVQAAVTTAACLPGTSPGYSACVQLYFRQRKANNRCLHAPSHLSKTSLMRYGQTLQSYIQYRLPSAIRRDNNT